MTTKERVALIKAFEYGINQAKQSNIEWNDYLIAEKQGNTVTMGVKQRLNDLHRGEAHGVAQALALIGSCKEQVKAIYKELGE